MLLLVVIPFFKGIELIRNFSHHFDEWLIFYYKRVIPASHSFFRVFAEQELYQGDIINTNYDTSLV